MKKKILFTLALAMLMAWPLGSVLAYEALIGGTGVLQWDPTKTKEDLILVSAMSWKSSYLIDREGYIVHEWKTNSTPGAHDRLLPNGHLLRGFTPTVDYSGNPIPASYNVPIGGASGGVQEFDWEGNLVWQYIGKEANKIQHHTFQRMPNGNTLILLWEKITQAEAIAAGRDPSTAVAVGLYPDMIEEVDATPYPGVPKLVKKWRVWDHIVQDRVPGIWSYGNVKDPKKFNLNYAEPNPFGYQDWTHANTVEYNDKTKELIINFRQWGEFYVLDWSGGASFGEIKARFGNPCAYGAGACPSFNNDGSTYLWGSHCVTFLDNGNYLAFDNGWARPTGTLSRAVEINPTKGGLKDSQVWHYQAGGGANSFYTQFQGGAGRLSNGNTFITSTGAGHLFEVTPGTCTWAAPSIYNPAGGLSCSGQQVVWELVLAARAGTDVSDKATCTIKDGATTGIHRAHAYNSAAMPGLQGKDLSRKGHITLGCPEMWKLWDTAYGALPTDPSKLSGFGLGGTGTVSGGGGASGGTGGSGGGGGY
jgi:hypothetical protein